MRAGIIFTGTGPILVLTTYDSFDDPEFVEKLCSKGIRKFIAAEVPIKMIQKRYAKYGNHFPSVIGDLREKNDLRVLDYNGHNVLQNFSFEEMGKPIYHE
jgi:hypothetical protein